MAGVKRITREEISTIRDEQDPWKINVNPTRPRKRPRLDNDEDPGAYIYEQSLAEYDKRLNFRYSVELFGNVVDWKKKGKGADKFKNYDKIEYSGLVIRIGDVVYVNFTDPDSLSSQDQPSDDADIKVDSDGDTGEDKGAEHSEPEAAAQDDEPISSIPPNAWVAKVLECRAFDEEHVFLRVLWLYRPEDLPGGRQPWHSVNEVFPSNDMQIIDAMTVTNMAKGLVKWDEKKNQTIDDDVLIWRQAVKLEIKGANRDYKFFGKLPTHCICGQPANPDKHLVRCGSCKHLMHDACIEQAAAENAARELPKEEDAAKNGDELPTSDTVEEAQKETYEEAKPNKNKHFNPLSGAVKFITNQVKRAASPLKHTSASKVVEDIATTVEEIGKSIMGSAPDERFYTARIVGLDPTDSGKPLQLEIRTEDSGDEYSENEVRMEKIHCLFCQSEIA